MSAACGRSSPAPAARPTCRGCWPPRRRCPCSACPCPSRHLQGQDSLLSIVQMPAGIPVATFAIGEAGATNAGLFAVALLAADDDDARRRARRRPGGPPRPGGVVDAAAAGVTSADRPAGDDRRARRRAARPLHGRRGAADGLRHGRARARSGGAGGAGRRRPHRGAVRRPRRPRPAGRRCARSSRPSSRTRRRRRSSGWRGDVVVAPAAGAVAIAQDRLAEKAFLRDARRPDRAVGARRATPGAGFPAIVKTARLGYDGKGQIGVADDAALAAAPRRARRARASSSSACRSTSRSASSSPAPPTAARSTYPVAENHHAGGILDLTVVPARIPATLAAEAAALALRIADALDYVGVLAVELFVSDGVLLVNELAPRPHNSGHWTLDAAGDEPVRPAGAGGVRPGARPDRRDRRRRGGDGQPARRPWADGAPDWAAALADPDARLHLYGKAEPRPGRKMGHLTVLGDDARRRSRHGHWRCARPSHADADELADHVGHAARDEHDRAPGAAPIARASGRPGGR